jgi:toxin-antitoxin system PIN domain toxin
VTTLLDSNVLIAVVTPSHVHHTQAERWLASLTDQYATCPITQGALVRMAIRGGATASDAQVVLDSLTSGPAHVFWADDLQYASVSLTGVVGHRQVTDAYLAGLARANRGTLATFDRGLAALHSDVCTLVAT